MNCEKIEAVRRQRWQKFGAALAVLIAVFMGALSIIIAVALAAVFYPSPLLQTMTHYGYWVIRYIFPFFSLIMIEVMRRSTVNIDSPQLRPFSWWQLLKIVFKRNG